MTRADDFQDGREQGWRDKQAEIERLRALGLNALDGLDSMLEDFRQLMPYSSRVRCLQKLVAERRAAFEQKAASDG